MTSPAPRSPLARLAPLVALLCAGCARGADEWMARLEHPDPFERALAAFGLCAEAPLRAGPAVPVLLETVDRTELRLGDEAAAALARVAPAVAGELAAELAGTALPTLERLRVLMEALIAAGAPAARPLVAQMEGRGRERAGELGAALVALGAPAAAPLADLLVRTKDVDLAAHACFLLGRLGPRAEAARPTLEVAAEGHPVERVRAAAREALAALGPVKGAPLGPPGER